MDKGNADNMPQPKDTEVVAIGRLASNCANHVTQKLHIRARDEQEIHKRRRASLAMCRSETLARAPGAPALQLSAVELLAQAAQGDFGFAVFDVAAHARRDGLV